MEDAELWRALPTSLKQHLEHLHNTLKYKHMLMVQVPVTSKKRRIGLMFGRSAEVLSFTAPSNTEASIRRLGIDCKSFLAAYPVLHSISSPFLPRTRVGGVNHPLIVRIMEQAMGETTEKKLAEDHSIGDEERKKVQQSLHTVHLELVFSASEVTLGPIAANEDLEIDLQAVPGIGVMISHISHTSPLHSLIPKSRSEPFEIRRGTLLTHINHLSINPNEPLESFERLFASRTVPALGTTDPSPTYSVTVQIPLHVVPNTKMINLLSPLRKILLEIARYLHLCHPKRQDAQLDEQGGCSIESLQQQLLRNWEVLSEAQKMRRGTQLVKDETVLAQAVRVLSNSIQASSQMGSIPNEGSLDFNVQGVLPHLIRKLTPNAESAPFAGSVLDEELKEVKKVIQGLPGGGGVQYISNPAHAWPGADCDLCGDHVARLLDHLSERHPDRSQFTLEINKKAVVYVDLNTIDITKVALVTTFLPWLGLGKLQWERLDVLLPSKLLPDRVLLNPVSDARLRIVMPMGNMRAFETGIASRSMRHISWDSHGEVVRRPWSWVTRKRCAPSAGCEPAAKRV